MSNVPTDTVNDTMNNVVKSLRERSAQQAEVFAEQLKPYRDTPHTIDASIFMTQFMEGFYYGNLDEEKMTDWCSIYPPTAPVGVVNQDGEVLVLVPPIVDTTVYDISPCDDLDETIIVAIGKLPMYETRAGDGQTIVAEDLIQRIETRTQTSAYRADFEEWCEDAMRFYAEQQDSPSPSGEAPHDGVEDTDEEIDEDVEVTPYKAVGIFNRG